MNKYRFGFALATFSLLMLLIVASMLLFSKSTRASATPGGVTAPAPKIVPGAVSAPAPAASGPQAPQTSSWVDIAPFPAVTIDFTPGPTPLKLKRAGAAAYPPNGKVYVLGGRHGVDGEDTNLRNIFEYTPGSPGTWATKAALLDSTQPGSRWTANMAVAVLTDTSGPRIYAIGGNNLNSDITSTVRIYNPVADSLSTLTTDPWPANPPRIPGGYAVYNNKLYIFGGFSALGSGAVYPETWVFDPMGGLGTKWTQLTNARLPLARAYIAGAALDGKIYAVGGDNWDPASRALLPVTNVEVLDPALPNNGWSAVAPLPSARGDMGAWAYDSNTGYEISGSLVVEGGVYPVPDSKGYQYHPATNSWNLFGGLIHATRNYGAAQLNGQLYALGGYDYSNNTPSGANFNQKYDATGPAATPTNTPVLSPTPTNTPDTSNYNICQFTGVSLVPGTTLVTGSQCDDCYVTVTLPFPYQLYDQTFTTAKFAANGTIGFNLPEANLVNTCLPDQAANYAIFGYWDDLSTTGSGKGIYTSVTGVAPNRVYNIEWRATRSSINVNFEVRLYEGQTVFDIIYAAVNSSGNSATVGVQRDSGSVFKQFSCNTSSLSAGLQLTFAFNSGTCPSPTPTFTSTSTPSNTPTLTGTPPTATATSTPTSTPCGTATNYIISSSTGAAIVAGTTDIGNHCDDCDTALALPFAFQLYGNTYNSVNVSSNGRLDFATANDPGGYTNSCLPASSSFNYTIFAHWDDLYTVNSGYGAYTSVSGSAPNRIFNIEWRTQYYPGTGTADFEVRLYEGQQRFDIIYGQVDQTGTSATVGVQGLSGSALYTQYECNTGGLNPGLQLSFTQPPCQSGSPTATNTPVATSTPTATRTNTNTPTATYTTVPTNTPTVQAMIVGHVTWQGRPAQPNALQQLPITLTLRLQSGGPDNEYTGLTTDASGYFTVSVGALGNGVYNWRAKGPLFLANGGPLTLSGAPVTNVEMGLMLTGDCNSDNLINVTDFGILKNTFGKAIGDPGYDARADFNGDDRVNIADFTLQKNNFGLVGAPPVTPGNPSSGK